MKNSNDLLMEIGCEEIPSRFLPGAMEQLKNGALSLLAEYRCKHGEISTYATPRRLVVLVKELASMQEDLVERVKGPPVNRAYDEQGQPTRALHGFIQSQGVSMEQIEEETIKDARYIFARKEIPGQPAENILPELLPQLIRKISFPRPMYWQSKEVRFARPIRWLLALYNSKELPFEFARVTAGRYTYGHRFLASGPFEVKDVDHYFHCLEESYIILDQDRRKNMIREQLEQKAAEIGGKALVEEELLEEVTYLVEYPVAIDGSFDQAYLDLPQEVPITTMQNHQRYFPIVEKESGRLMPYFIGISNNKFNPNIRKGYAKVLQARLADGQFFFNEDRKKSLEEYVGELKNVVFLESLGTLDQKRARLVELTCKLSDNLTLPAEKIEKAKRIAHLCKADLVTGMVNEFTELQGVMGREYARLSGEDPEVANGIYEHYLPRYYGDYLPSKIETALVSLVDRIDTLAGCFAIGIQPTGSQDPYGLRRQAQGAISILLGLEINLSLEEYLDRALDTITSEVPLENEEREKVKTNLWEFMIQRIRFILQEKGTGHDLVEAVLAVPFNTVGELFNRVNVLSEYLKGPLLDDVIIAYNRVANLAAKAPGGDIDQNLLTEPAEKDLFSKYQVVSDEIEALTDPVKMLEKVQTLKEPVDDFFDDVMVMVDDDKIRENRLNMLLLIKKLFNRLADFSKLQTP
ncbi:MAG: glycine--tRNA ligase subunit beta [Bacillota bacterium]